MGGSGNSAASQLITNPEHVIDGIVSGPDNARNPGREEVSVSLPPMNTNGVGERPSESLRGQDRGTERNGFERSR